MQIDGQDVLRYRPFPVDVAVVRGTYSDDLGNISACEEPADLNSYSIALAAKNTGGIVIAQVREIVGRGRLRPRRCRYLATSLILSLSRPIKRKPTTESMTSRWLAWARVRSRSPSKASPTSSARLSRGAERSSLSKARPSISVTECPAGIAEHIVRSGHSGDYWFTIEQGIHGGELLTGDMFGIAANPTAILSASEQFDLYSGGGLEQTYLGLAEMDGVGNVNVSHFGGQISGPGEFIRHFRKPPRTSCSAEALTRRARKSRCETTSWKLSEAARSPNWSVRLPASPSAVERP